MCLKIKMKQINQLLDTLIQNNERKMTLLRFACPWRDMEEKKLYQ
jgi:hypothetical protein